MKNVEDFKRQVKAKNITYWHIHDCSLCGYGCGYHFINDEVYYDNGCYCTNGKNLNPRSWEDLAESYNMQTNEGYIKKMDDFFGFDNEPKLIPNE